MANDRQFKLRNYAARKAAERQDSSGGGNDSQQQQSHSHSQSHQSQSRQRSSQRQGNNSSSNNSNGESAPTIQLSHAQKARQRSLLKSPNQNTTSNPILDAAVIAAVGASDANSKSQRRRANNENNAMSIYGNVSGSNIGNTVIGGYGGSNGSSKYGSPTRPTASSSSSSSALAIHHRSNNNKATSTSSPTRSTVSISTSALSDTPLAAPSSKTTTSSSSSLSLFSNKKKKKTNNNMSNAQKAAFMASKRRNSSGNGNSNDSPSTNSNGALKTSVSKIKEEEESSAGTRGISLSAASGGGGIGKEGDNNNKASTTTTSTSISNYASSTIGLPSLDARDKMKQLFAARRRKAQIEMTTPTISSTTSTSTSTSAGGEEDDRQDDSGRGHRRQMSSGSVATVNTIGTMGTVNTVNTHGTASTSNSGYSAVTSTSSRSNNTSATTSTYSSRKALDRYLGRSRGNSSASSNSVASSSSGSSVSRSNGIGISASSSSDSNDTHTTSHTVGSMHSRSTNGNGGGGLNTLTPVKEESFTGSTASGSNVGLFRDNSSGSANNNSVSRRIFGSIGESDGIKNNDVKGTRGNHNHPTEDNTGVASSSSIHSANDNDGSNGILQKHPPKRSSSSSSKENNDDLVENEKSVRFHLSPLERHLQKNTNTNNSSSSSNRAGQCSPPRNGDGGGGGSGDVNDFRGSARSEDGRDARRKDQGRKERSEVGQCSPPRSRSSSNEEHHHATSGNNNSIVRRDGPASRTNVVTATQSSSNAAANTTTNSSIVRMSMESQGSMNSVRSTESTRAFANAGIMLVEEEEDMEFTMFVAGLRREVAGDHVELWSGFQTILGRIKQHQVPLHEAYVDEKSMESYDRNGKKKKKKKVKMDPQTQTSLTTIHKHLMENGRVKGKFMTTSSQLVNDKKVKKDREKDRSSGGADSSRHDESARDVRAKDRRGDALSGSIHSQTSSLRSSQNNNASSNSQNDDGKQHKQESSSSSSWMNKKSLGSLKLTPSKPSMKSFSSSSNNPLGSVKLRSVTSRNKGSSPKASGGSSRGSPRYRNNGGKSPRGSPRGAPASAKKERLSWMEALKKKQKGLRLKQQQLPDVDDDNTDNGFGGSCRSPLAREKSSSSFNHGELRINVNSQTNTNTDNDNREEMSNKTGELSVQLRRIASPRKKPRITPPSTPEEPVAPWAKVQLRSTPKKRESMTPTTPNISPKKAASLPSIQASWNSSSSSSSRNFALSPVSLSSRTVALSPKVSKESSSSSTDPGPCSVGDIIDLDNLPEKAFPSDEGHARIFLLKGNTREDKVVIVGKTVIVTASILSCSSSSGSNQQKATITWHTRRSEIRALTLNVEATGANLAHSQGRTPLMFESSDVCLEFCSAFYGRSPSSIGNSSGAQEGGSAGARGSSGPSIPASKSLDNANHDRGNNIIGQSNLTEDEESLLDRYRKFSQNDRTKLRLTCLSPRGETEEVEVLLSPPSNKNLGLAFGGGSKPNTASTGVDEKAATKFRKMLKMGVPPDAVRHKMVTENLDAATISAVLEQPTASQKDGNGASSSLSEGDEKLATKYRKMLKMGIPPDAVQHKMTADGIQSNVVDAVLNEGKSKKESVGPINKLTEEEEKVATKFRKMLKMGVPPDAAKHKMIAEGVESKIIESVLGIPSQGSKQTAQLSNEDEVVATKYRKMLKMGIPLDGVQHKMKQDGIDLKIVSVLVDEAGGGSTKGAAANKPVTKKSSKAAAGPVLSKEEEKIASTYRNMLKVCIPKDAVLHKMKREGIDAKIIEAVIGKEGGGSSGESTDGKNGGSAPINQRKTIAFHWTTQNLAPELLEQSIFGKTELKKRKIASINPEEADIKKLEELFQKRNSKAASKMKGAGGGKGGEVGTDMAKLLDLTRANNIAISLKAFNDFTFRSLAETINDIDPDSKIVGERVQFIPNLLPMPKEIAAIKKYKGDDDKLITAELFFRQLSSIKRIEDKVSVMNTMVTFEEHISETRAGFKTLQKVCGQVMNSEKLIQILEMVLNVGNLMNAGTLNGGVEAFKFESLPRLSQTKSADGKTTVLDYIVETFIEKGERNALLLMPEFPDIQDSSRLLIGDLMGDMNTLQKNYKLCKTELASMKRDQSAKRVTRSMSKKITNESEAVDPRKAMFAAIQSRGGGLKEKKADSPKQEEASDPRQALFAAIQNKKKGSATTSEKDGASASNVNYTPGVHRLQTFLNHSKTTLSLAEQDQDASVRACKGLAVYCGEQGERAAAPLLQVLSNFALSLENGVKKYDNRAAAEKRNAAKKKKEAEKLEKGKENTLKNAAPVATPPRKLLKASSLQPHVGVTFRAKKGNTTAGQEKVDTMSALLNAIKGKNPPKSSTPPGPNAQMTDPNKALLASIKSRAEPGSRKSDSQLGSTAENIDPKQAMLASIKNRNDKNSQKTRNPPTPTTQTVDPKHALMASIKKRRESLPSKTPPDGVPDRVKHINTTLVRKESRVLLVNKMLSEAPASVKQDFLKGFTYQETNDPLLKKIYEKEDSVKGDMNTKNKLKPADPRQDMFAAIRSLSTFTLDS